MDNEKNKFNIPSRQERDKYYKYGVWYNRK